jgi:hypothetical protein
MFVAVHSVVSVPPIPDVLKVTETVSLTVP